MTTVKLTAEATEQLERLPKTAKERIAKLFTRLEKWPDISGVKRLAGNLAGWFRVRTGDYRVRFFIKNDVIFVDKIGDRKDVYDN